MVISKNWLVHKQTAFGKDFLKPFMVDNLPKIVWFSTLLASQQIVASPGSNSSCIGYSRANGNCLKLIDLMNLCTKLIDKVTILENALKQSKESHAQTLTMLMRKVKRLEDKLKSIFEEEYRKLCLVLILLEAKDSEVCKITRADGSSSFHGDIQALLRRLDRQDLSQLYSLVQERFKDYPLEGHDLDLWGDLRMIFDPNEEDDI
ncbi:hypothetical protein Tco_0980844 [Tanacetum coccineum]